MMLSEICQTQKHIYHKAPGRVGHRNRKQDSGRARGWGRGRELVFPGVRVSVQDDENVLEMEGGDVYPITRMSLIPHNCTLTNSEEGKFCNVWFMIILPKGK